MESLWRWVRVRTYRSALTKRVRARREPRPTDLVGSEGVSGVWVGARKLEGELDVEQRRIIRLSGNP
jgi:hypothetical protein